MMDAMNDGVVTTDEGKPLFGRSVAMTMMRLRHAKWFVNVAKEFDDKLVAAPRCDTAKVVAEFMPRLDEMVKKECKKNRYSTTCMYATILLVLAIEWLSVVMLQMVEDTVESKKSKG